MPGGGARGQSLVHLKQIGFLSEIKEESRINNQQPFVFDFLFNGMTCFGINKYLYQVKKLAVYVY